MIDLIKKKFLKAYGLILFPEKRMNLILGVVHESHADPVSAKAILKIFTFFFWTTSYPTLYIIVIWSFLLPGIGKPVRSESGQICYESPWLKNYLNWIKLN